MKNETENSGKDKKAFFTPKRVFLGVLGLGALGFGYWYATRRTNKPGEDDPLNIDSGTSNAEIPSNTQPVKPKPATPKKPSVNETAVPTLPKTPASDFPLKRGSRGDKVVQLQKTLLNKYPGIIKSPDGVFGKELQAALASKGLPTEITESQFTVLTTVEPETIADNIFNAAKKKDFKATLSAIGDIRNTTDYKAVNEKFKPKGLIGGSSTTIVTGLLLTFTDPAQKDQLNIAFTTIGLEKKDGKWFVPDGVSGIERKTIITKQPTKVWRNAKNMVQVGANTILGYEVQSGEGITIFDTIDGYRLFVLTAHVKYN